MGARADRSARREAQAEQEAPPTLLTAANLRVPHGFSTRDGGVSKGPYAGLNLGLSTGDEPESVEQNRDRLLGAFGVSRARTCALHQVHGDRVVDATPSWFELEADAAISTEPGLAVVIGAADCYPLLFYAPDVPAVAAAHCGWRGTVRRLGAKVVTALVERFGGDRGRLQVAIGPGICQACYQVGPEVVAAFEVAGFPVKGPHAVAVPDDEGRYRLDLAAANRSALEQVGVPAANIVALGQCTSCTPELFYSHRRDAGRTGRHWALIRLPGPTDVSPPTT